MADGRFAPSPSARLHLGNLRTALIAWLAARSSGGRFLVRIEDLDPASSREEHVRSALADLDVLGLDHDGEVIRQSHRRERHEEALTALLATGETYPCYCTRREILADATDAVRAPHGPGVAYAGTCRDLGARARAEREAAGRRPSLRVRGEGRSFGLIDAVVGPYEGSIDDFVIRRADGVPAYNLAVVVDDHDQGIEQVVRGDDLLETTPRQLFIAELLGFTPPSHAHVPLVLDATGERVAKRHGAVTLAEQEALGRSAAEVLAMFAVSLGLAAADEPVRAIDLIDRFDLASLSREPWRMPSESYAAHPGADHRGDGRPRSSRRSWEAT
ncbi:MAG: tRNA glutamyl-Q(34) synthetase GluQRS [Actinobacteria bacterium]|nr:tRNA glutamyl-Q(34) synthetase GluQRS [Actinomycetota bacterium]